MMTYPTRVKAIRPYKGWDVGDTFTRTRVSPRGSYWYLLDNPHSWNPTNPLSEYEVRRYLGVFFAEIKVRSEAA